MDILLAVIMANFVSHNCHCFFDFGRTLIFFQEIRGFPRAFVFHSKLFQTNVWNLSERDETPFGNMIWRCASRIWCCSFVESLNRRLDDLFGSPPRCRKMVHSGGKIHAKGSFAEWHSSLGPITTIAFQSLRKKWCWNRLHSFRAWFTSSVTWIIYMGYNMRVVRGSIKLIDGTVLFVLMGECLSKTSCIWAEPWNILWIW